MSGVNSKSSDSNKYSGRIYGNFEVKLKLSFDVTRCFGWERRKTQLPTQAVTKNRRWLPGVFNHYQLSECSLLMS